MPKTLRSEETIELPDGVKANIGRYIVTVEGPKGKISKKLESQRVQIEAKEGTVVVSCDKPKRKDLALLGTYRGHISNMIKGVTNGYEYHMKIVYSHFPIKATAKGEMFKIENFIGEKHPRSAKIIGETKVSVKGSDVVVFGINKEEVGQTAANIEMATKIRGYDTRIFQDGIYIVKKGVVSQ